MKTSTILCWKKLQVIKLNNTGYVAAFVNGVLRKVHRIVLYRSNAARLLLWRVRSKWKQLLMSRPSNTMRYNYDAQSYFKNFDHGSADDNPSPLAPRSF